MFLSQTLDGMWRLDGMLPTELGEVLAGELDRRSRALYESDKAAADADGTPLARTAAQRRADALVELALHASVNEDGATINRPAVTAVIHVDQVTNPATEPGDPVGQSEHGQPVTKTTAERLLCDCAMSRVVLDANSVPISFSATINGRADATAIRGALGMTRSVVCIADPAPTARTATACIPAGAPPTHPARDHHTPLRHAPTSHHRVHEGGFKVQRMPDGQLEFRRPDGTALAVPKQPHSV